MKLYELVNKYHIGTDLSCAEAMFKACNEYYHLNLSEDVRKMFSVMGVGMETQISCCGAFTVAVAMIGLFTIKDGQLSADNELAYEKISELTDFMFTEFGSIQCAQLNSINIEGEDACLVIVESIAKKLGEWLDNFAFFGDN